LPAYAVTEDDRRRLARALRDLRYNPQRHLPPGASGLADLAREKQEWVGRSPPTRAGRRERYRRLRPITAAPVRGGEGDLERARQALERVERQLEANALLRRRDYAFPLYPEAALRPLCTRFA